ncbi:hypothetical protein JTE90_021675 [Oedothorax gibbosus]|uniref:Uncharacterized protein n=1 Tax=Oedothorax gibbosus TaxID=931172 RepID=A0AAV6TFJ4_9ARAC|nr:hypothetical protein JTE90_021675 [Oedothorax gibbosus]
MKVKGPGGGRAPSGSLSPRAGGTGGTPRVFPFWKWPGVFSAQLGPRKGGELLPGPGRGQGKTLVEVRSGSDVQIDRLDLGLGGREKIETISSWFPPKFPPRIAGGSLNFSSSG